ncbi:MAG: DUF4236 domain-containing protein, partial [Gemmatimonadetes bacterium]|nr:DUF4236 domain-containing protein [Gemmatimonadota bacterium]
MGFYVRKSVTAGPFRFTFSKSGIGVSAGIKGLRVGTGPRGSYVRVGAGGLSYRMSIPSGAPRGPGMPNRVSPRTTEGGFTPIASGDVLQMVDVSSAVLLEEINARHRRMRLGPLVAGAGVLLVLMVLAGGWPAWAVAAVLAAAGAGTVLAYQRDAMVRAIVLMYDLEPFAEQVYERLHAAYAALAAAHASWNVTARAGVTDWKRNAGASTLIQRNAVRLGTGAPPVVKTNIAVPVIPAGRHTLCFFPDRVLVFGPGGVGAVPYPRLRVHIAPTRFIESGPVPRDARIVDHTWRYVNKGGGPDRRFRDNAQIPIALYEEIGISSETGLNVVLQLSRLGGGEAFR